VPGSLLNNPAIVSVLGLLTERPLHLYALSQELDQRLDAQGLPLGRGSLRNVLTALVDAGWVRVEERPTPNGVRSVFATTEAGRHELRDRVERQVADPRSDHDHLAQAVAYLGLLEPAEAAGLLRRRAADVRALVEGVKADVEAAVTAGLPELYVIEGGYAVALREAEVAWLEATARRIESGDLAWPTS
jgi:DNA-binding PadR family transcriptional regulator